MAWIIHTPRRSRRELIIEFAGRPVTLRAAWRRNDGAMVLAAQCVDEVVLRAARRHGGYSVVEGDPGFLDTDEVPQAASRPAPVFDAIPAPVRAALQNGWGAIDLLGAGEGGDWGPGGGHSHRSGLTMAEMALSRAPASWQTKGDTRYPWEVLGWTPPGIGWVAPAAPSKSPLEVDVGPSGEEDDTLLGAGDDPSAHLDGADGADDDDGADDTGEPATVVAPVASAEPKPKRAPKVAKASKLAAQAALTTWTDEDRTRGTDVMASLIAQGTVPSLSKAKHHFKRQNLPVLDEASYQALLESVPV